MSTLEITCPSCDKVTRLPADKVPDRPVAYRCPSCKGKLVVDKAKLLAEVPSTPPAALPGPAEPSPIDLDLEDLEMPPGATFPPGFLVLDDGADGAAVRTALAAAGCELRDFGVEEARARAVVSPPRLILYRTGAAGPPPHAPLAPLIDLPPRERRIVYLVLIADDVPTLDGNQAFLHGVNLLVNSEHIGHLAGLLHSGLRYHRRLFQPLLAAVGDLDD